MENLFKSVIGIIAIVTIFQVVSIVNEPFQDGVIQEARCDETGCIYFLEDNTRIQGNAFQKGYRKGDVIKYRCAETIVSYKVCNFE